SEAKIRVHPISASVKREGFGMARELYGAIEGGGTKFICAVATAPEPGAIVATEQFPTHDAGSTLADVAAFFGRADGQVVSLGVACFGPIELDRSRPTYGHVLATPNPGWSHAPVLPFLSEALRLRHVLWDTDVNAAALGEATWGAGRGADPLV